ncbi:MAG: hypothetical protein KKE37_12465 [Verrucomicrobia bacterium]|nr:hypothetical protein [Verrucomicrobiota bacterium]MBU4289634.1 hypothetical protein [Verrucomicrobiota bacterium]MBU4430151.1 hypothetical protein [Verrucomicrobiota bacterium]MCG2679497.1 hypothetical protein [Kiritimatiellia bacterium]
MTATGQSSVVLKKGERLRLALTPTVKGPARLAALHLQKIFRDELGGHSLEIVAPEERACTGRIVALCRPWDTGADNILRQAKIERGTDGRIRALGDGLPADQGFIAVRWHDGEDESLLLVAETETGLKHALLTLADRLYRDDRGNIVADCLDGVHQPAFIRRHLKTDAMNCGPFRSRFGYWNPTSRTGIDEFADWLASFRISDYNLLAFVRGWGLTYASERFPSLVDSQHPNPDLDFYPHLLDRFHDWGIKVWASDIYIASGYSMEAGTCPEILSPTANASRFRPFKAGHGSFAEILDDPEAIVCLSHPAAGKFYADIVTDILGHYPSLDGLDFHIGHTFPGKICRCSQCQGLAGNRQGVYRCFAQVYEAAVKQQSHVRLKTAVKMFGDATRSIVEHYQEFPRLEFFCWLRWLGNFLIERTDAPVTLGHEDGGGGLEANHDPKKTLGMIRDYYRDYEPWIWTYVQKTRAAGVPSISWEPALHREMEQMFFLYSQLTWEPDLSWTEFARRYVIRSERRLNARLQEAYTLALEANAAITSWGLQPHELGQCQRVTQTRDLLQTKSVHAKIMALQQMVDSPDITRDKVQEAPPFFDLRRSLAKASRRLQAGEALNQWH